MHHISFDIETGPLPDEELARMRPEFKAPKNYKDPEKIARSISEQAEEWKEGAALSALTGRVMAIGYSLVADDLKAEFRGDTISVYPEEEILSRFWTLITQYPSDTWIGFRIHAFDLPFIVRRSWRHRLPMPPMDRLRNRGWWHPRFVDLQVEWQLGDRQAGGSLDAISKHLRTGAKNGDGADFARLLVENPEKALAYLRNDVELNTAAWLTFLGPY